MNYEQVQQFGELLKAVPGQSQEPLFALWVAITHNLLIWIRDLVTTPSVQPEPKRVSAA